MTLEVFIRDIVPILQLILTFLTLFSLVLLWRQIKEAHLWNKLNSKYNFIDVPLTIELERNVLNAIKPLGDLDIPITDVQAEAALNNQEARLAIKAFLNDFENLCAAINVGYVDEELAYQVHAVRVLRAFRVLRAYIEKRRKISNDEELYIELEKTALDWQRKKISLRNSQASQLEELNRRLDEAKGIKKKVK